MATIAMPRVPDELEERIERSVIFPDGSIQNPYPGYAELRAIAPVYRTRSGIWLVTGYKPYTEIARDKRVSRADAARTEMGDIDALPEDLRPAIRAFAGMIINQDDPGHFRVRKIVRHAFLPDYAKAWIPQVKSIARQVVGAAAEMEEFDFLTEVGYRLPEIVMTDLIGVPHTDRHLFAGWSHDIVSFSRVTGGRAPDIDRVRQAMKNFHGYTVKIVQERRARGDMDGEDMLSVLLRAEDEGDRLGNDELIGSMMALIQASHETTANLVGNAMYHLLDKPHLMAELRGDRSLIPAAVEEFLRYESSSHSLLPRAATQDIEISGVTIPAGGRISLLTAAANRDPEVFENPDEVSFHRGPRERHVAFGGGPHSCLGQNLARIEAVAMLEEIVETLSGHELKEQPRFASGRGRALESLRIGRAQK
jgi:cytochrome P450